MAGGELFYHLYRKKGNSYTFFNDDEVLFYMSEILSYNWKTKAKRFNIKLAKYVLKNKIGPDMFILQILMAKMCRLMYKRITTTF